MCYKSADKLIYIMKQKKSIALSVETLIIIALLLVFLVVYLVFIKGGLGKGASGINDQFDKGSDPDNDGVINIADKCPDVKGEPGNDGCPYKEAETRIT